MGDEADALNDQADEFEAEDRCQSFMGESISLKLPTFFPKSKAHRGTTVEILCSNPSCAIMKKVRIADRKRGWGKYCSKSCKAEHQYNRGK